MSNGTASHLNLSKTALNISEANAKLTAILYRVLVYAAFLVTVKVNEITNEQQKTKLTESQKLSNTKFFMVVREATAMQAPVVKIMTVLSRIPHWFDILSHRLPSYLRLAYKPLAKTCHLLCQVLRQYILSYESG